MCVLYIEVYGPDSSALLLFAPENLHGKPAIERLTNLSADQGFTISHEPVTIWRVYNLSTLSGCHNVYSISSASFQLCSLMVLRRIGLLSQACRSGHYSSSLLFEGKVPMLQNPGAARIWLLFYFSALDSFTVWYQVYMVLTSLQFLCRYGTFHHKGQGFLFQSSFSPTGKHQPHFPQLYIQVLCSQGLSCVRPLDRGSDSESQICSLHKLRVSWRHVVLAFCVLKPFARNSDGCITVAHEWFTALSQTKYWHFILFETQSIIISWARLRLEWLINRCCL